jgi:hypothetical protein
MKSKLPLRIRIWRLLWWPIKRYQLAWEGRKLSQAMSDFQSFEELAFRLERYTEANYRRSRVIVIGALIATFIGVGILCILASFSITMEHTGISYEEWLQGVLSGIGVEAIGAAMTFIVIEVVWIRWDSRREKRFKTEMRQLQKLWDLAYPDDNNKKSYTNFRTPPPE